tara:strand:+ start:389 stop:997 length:609 start_codon:yes stop_codon:yes gene_type:complete
MEDLAFRRMLDLFYESEKPLPFELKRIAKLIGMSDFQEEIRDVLNEFWSETESGWVNDRANEEIAKYQAKADSARVNGKKGGRPVKPKITQSVNLANPEITESQANHKPITINHKPNKEILSLVNDVFAHWWNLYPSSRRKNKGGCLTKFRAKCKNLGEDQIIELVDKMSADVARRVKEIDDIKFLPTTEPYINQERWMDEE